VVFINNKKRQRKQTEFKDTTPSKKIRRFAIRATKTPSAKY
jgi:hypothetical protein